jgi:hypothetical protein
VGLTLAAAVYCLVHGLVIDVEMNLPRTMAWAVTSTLPWLCAWEGLKRLDKRPAQSLQLLLSAGVLIAALVVCVALEYALGAIYSTDTDSVAQIVYRLLPIPIGIAVMRRLMQPSKPLRTSQADPVLNVPTRQGTLAVRARCVAVRSCRSAANSATTQLRSSQLRSVRPNPIERSASGC